MKSTRSDVQSFDAAFSVIDREITKIIAAIKLARPAGTTPPKRPHSRAAAGHKAA